jgi:hypothetical protein
MTETTSVRRVINCSNKSEVVSIFLGKCCLLSDLVDKHEKVSIPEKVMDSMFSQSEYLLGVN